MSTIELEISFWNKCVECWKCILDYCDLKIRNNIEVEFHQERRKYCCDKIEEARNKVNEYSLLKQLA